MSLDDEQAELFAEQAEHEVSGARDVAAKSPEAGRLQTPDTEPTAAAGTSAMASTAAEIVATARDGVATVMTPDGGPAAPKASIARVDVVVAAARSIRAAVLLALTLTAAAGIVIGRATMGRYEGNATGHASTASEPPTSEIGNERIKLASGAAVAETAGRDAVPTVDVTVAAVEPPPAVVATRIAPSAPPPAVVAKPKRDPGSAIAAMPQRGAVTAAEAMTAAQGALPALRDCDGAPPTITADLRIHHGHGIVTKLNLHPPAPNDPGYPWHRCVQRSLEKVRFPESETAGQARVRLTLR